MRNLPIWLKLRQLIPKATVVGINFRKFVRNPCVSDFTLDGLDKVAVNQKCDDNRQGFEPKLAQAGSTLAGVGVAFDRGQSYSWSVLGRAS